MAEKAFVRDRCTVLPMQSRSMLIPALKQSSSTFQRGQSQFFGGVVMSWTPEANVIAESDAVFREVELVARDLTFVSVASNQLLQDNAVALDTLLTTMFQEVCAWSYDYYILQGQYANEPIGVINAPGTYAYSRNTANSVLLPDIANMLSHLYTQSWDNACWIANPSVIPQLITMTNNASNAPFLTWLNPAPGTGDGPIAQKIPAMLAGLPIFWSEKASYLGSRGDLILADFSKYILGDRLAIQVEVSPHIRFPQNQMMWRVIVRWDGTPWQDAPITLADQTQMVSPMVTLV
jgi:HK97 family phage major capsid protein